MPKSKSSKHPEQSGRVFARAVAVLGFAFLLLLIPLEKAPGWRGAGQQPFAWKQDAFWAELERQFLEARAAGSDILEERIDAAISEVNRLMEDIFAKRLPPEDNVFTALETSLFRLAPMIAACPQRMPDYVSVMTRTRTELKRQSRHWDLNSRLTRQRIYRLLYGARMALEEAMLQTPADLHRLILCEDEPSKTPAVEILGLQLHSGDILVSRGGAPTSALIARGNDYPGSFSHVALLHVDETTGAAWIVESHIERGVAIASLDEYLQEKKLRIMVLRLRADLPAVMADPMLPHQAAIRAIEEARRGHIRYDFAMNYRDHRAQFCSEVVSAAYEQVGVRLWMGISFISSPTVTAWLGSLGAQHFETQEPADLEYDPQVQVVAEWRDPATLFKAHVDDAVTDVMVEEAKPGETLQYNRFLLPSARLLKAYSVGLNALGKVGPVPEGMSATTALRVRKYRRDHGAVAARVFLLADEFKKTKGYPPPYWVLLDLARQAKHEVEKKQ